MGDIRGRGRKGLVDHVDLGRMDRDPAGKALAPGEITGATQASFVLVIGIDRIERMHARGMGREEELGAHHLIRKIPNHVRPLAAVSAESAAPILRPTSPTHKTGEALYDHINPY